MADDEVARNLNSMDALDFKWRDGAIAEEYIWM